MEGLQGDAECCLACKHVCLERLHHLPYIPEGAAAIVENMVCLIELLLDRCMHALMSTGYCDACKGIIFSLYFVFLPGVLIKVKILEDYITSALL